MRVAQGIRESVAAGDWPDVARRLAAGEGRTAAGGVEPGLLSPDVVAVDDLHRIRQEYLRVRDPRFRRAPWGPRSRRALEALRRDGLFHVPGALPPARLDRVRAAIDAGLAATEPESFVMYDQRGYWRDDQQMRVFNDALALSFDLAWLCRRQWLRQTANHYLGKLSHIKRVYGMRYLPKEGVDSHQFGWHHDMEDRYLKVMVLLTDISADDQYMSYITGSHNRVLPRDRFFKNTLTWDDTEHEPDSAPVVNTLGRAGDAFLFDPNGMHRGVRSLGAPRDAIFIEFTADGNLGNVWGSELGVAEPDRFGRGPDDPLWRFRGLEPKWERVKDNPRRYTSWIESLDDPDNWLRPSDLQR